MSLATPWPERLYHGGGAGPVWLVSGDGWRRQVDATAWHRLTPADESVLELATGPVLDVGCGPGRLAAELASRGIEVLGIDTSATAVQATRLRGSPAERVSVFGPVPQAGSWATILLLDGNIGIGGDPLTLLSRCASLLAGGGTVLVETEPPGASGRSARVKVEVPAMDGHHPGTWFDWATVSTQQALSMAGDAGFSAKRVWSVGDGRWFCQLGKRRPVLRAVPQPELGSAPNTSS